jgi:hypothetical protein
MSAEDYKLYNFIEFHVKDETQQTNPLLNAILYPDRRSGKDRRKKHKYVKAEVKINVEGAEITASGGTVTATMCKDGEVIQAVGAVIKKK